MFDLQRALAERAANSLSLALEQQRPLGVVVHQHDRPSGRLAAVDECGAQLSLRREVGAHEQSARFAYSVKLSNATLTSARPNPVPFVIASKLISAGAVSFAESSLIQRAVFQ